jgi:hypothetical protein
LGHNRRMEAATITRQALYELVWTVPRSRLAARFGVSDVAIAKRCRKLAIPMPGTGYWARVAAGQKPRRRKLPRAPDGVETESVFGALTKSELAGAVSVPEVFVSERLSEPHAAVAWIAEAFKKATPDEHDRFVVGHSWFPDVCVRKSTIERALRIVDALFRALEARGHRVEAQRPERLHSPERELIVTVFGQPFTLHVEEKHRQKLHVATKDELREQAAKPWYKPRKWDPVPEGDILLRFARGGHYLYTGRTSWSDTKVRKLDSQLGQVILEMERIGEFMRVWQDEQKKEAEARRDNERRQLRGERVDWWRRKLSQDLECMARDWRQAQDVRDFLDAYTARTQGVELPGFAQPWLEAARRYAEKLDPLASPATVAKDLEPSDEFLEQAIAEAEAAATQDDGPGR